MLALKQAQYYDNEQDWSESEQKTWPDCVFSHIAHQSPLENNYQDNPLDKTSTSAYIFPKHPSLSHRIDCTLHCHRTRRVAQLPYQYNSAARDARSHNNSSATCRSWKSCESLAAPVQPFAEC